jgi:hypothetical protein
MKNSITFFPVDNGDMVLITLGDGATMLTDVNIRKDADDQKNDEVRDVARDLRDRLKVDSKGRPYVDVFMLSHPDQDHCRGIQTHFYLGDINDYADDEKELSEKKIVIRELWSSPLIFRRASSLYTLCEDAKALATEARRRVKVNLMHNFRVDLGNKILILGSDINGKVDNLGPICIKEGEVIHTICGNESDYFKALLLAPFEPQGSEDEEVLLAKNQSSIVVNFSFFPDRSKEDEVSFLLGGDAEVYIWEKLWLKYGARRSCVFECDLLLAPHHCSWHSLSYDSWSEKGENAVVNESAKSALTQGKHGAIVVFSSKFIEDDANDPPCIRAKKEYKKFYTAYCTGEYPSKNSVEPLTFTFSKYGIVPPYQRNSAKKIAGMAGASSEPLPHG